VSVEVGVAAATNCPATLPSCLHFVCADTQGYNIETPATQQRNLSAHHQQHQQHPPLSRRSSFWLCSADGFGSSRADSGIRSPAGEGGDATVLLLGLTAGDAGDAGGAAPVPFNKMLVLFLDDTTRNSRLKGAAAEVAPGCGGGS
jgi:hypothetical protein